MPAEGRNPLDHVAETATDARARRFAEIDRREGEGPGAKEMAMTRRARDEDAVARARAFLDIARRQD